MATVLEINDKTAWATRREVLLSDRSGLSCCLEYPLSLYGNCWQLTSNLGGEVTESCDNDEGQLFTLALHT